MFKAIFALILSCLSAWLYRAGGQGKPYNTKYRDIGCPLATLILYILLQGFNLGFLWAYLFTFALMWGSMTTYWKTKGTDAYWLNWLFTGLGYSLSVLPIVCVTRHWLGFGIRTVLLIGLTVLWSEKMGNVVWEEGGRGFILTATIPLLLI